MFISPQVLLLRTFFQATVCTHCIGGACRWRLLCSLESSDRCLPPSALLWVFTSYAYESLAGVHSQHVMTTGSWALFLSGANGAIHELQMVFGFLKGCGKKTQEGSVTEALRGPKSWNSYCLTFPGRLAGPRTGGPDGTAHGPGPYPCRPFCVIRS